MRRRYMPVSELRISTHALQVLRRMRDQKAGIYFDDEGCTLLTEPPRELSHKCVKSLRAMRLIRNRDNDPAHYVLTGRGLEILDIDPRTRKKEVEA